MKVNLQFKETKSYSIDVDMAESDAWQLKHEFDQGFFENLDRYIIRRSLDSIYSDGIIKEIKNEI